MCCVFTELWLRIEKPGNGIISMRRVTVTLKVTGTSYFSLTMIHNLDVVFVFVWVWSRLVGVSQFLRPSNMVFWHPHKLEMVYRARSDASMGLCEHLLA